MLNRRKSSFYHGKSRIFIRPLHQIEKFLFNLIRFSIAFKNLIDFGVADQFSDLLVKQIVSTPYST